LQDGLSFDILDKRDEVSLFVTSSHILSILDKYRKHSYNKSKKGVSLKHTQMSSFPGKNLSGILIA